MVSGVKIASFRIEEEETREVEDLGIGSGKKEEIRTTRSIRIIIKTMAITKDIVTTRNKTIIDKTILLEATIKVLEAAMAAIKAPDTDLRRIMTNQSRKKKTRSRLSHFFIDELLKALSVRGYTR
ncbi:hypothetical protein PtA15_5A772 [Puccinia triticina]|uniref:Uncharacterized protein n=1 Tax=Puccinia triticina TaxID=208348 RepID=A0ABY7CLJ6_9BASI|nr:uncharacterized protein PtA15_5A772 [Puccinia triticina]WAQ85198.1 hypothetical protein PtA15_5A772 [Puccinia triticina]WAR58531.1 hypothetical protein PtB15_5B765 [Puccinia triticina]